MWEILWFMPSTITFRQATKNPEALALRVFCYHHINQRLNRSTNEYCVFAVFVSSSLSNAELCACSDV
jgi:hypothetical protein